MAQQIDKQTRQRIKQILPKLKCAFHQSQTLTNFCSCKKCLLPLCPSCIKIHTIEHVNMKNDPEYDNLAEIIYDLNQELKGFTAIYEESYQLFSDVQKKVNQFKNEIWKSIEDLKRCIIEQVQIYFRGVTEAAQQKIYQMSYIQQLQIYKSQLKKTTTIIKNLQKSFLNPSTTGKHLIRNLIKYHSNNIDQSLSKFDSLSQQFISKLQGNFCTLSIRQNLKDNLMAYLTQIFKININQIPIIKVNSQDQIYQNGVFRVTKKLQPFVQQKSSQKNQIKNSLTNILSKSIHKNNSQNKVNKKINLQTSIKDKQNFNETQNQNLLTKTIFDSNQKRSFVNHSSQRKSLKVSGNFESDMSCINLGQNSDGNQFSYTSQTSQKVSKYERRSNSKGKGLTLIHSNTIHIPDSKITRANPGPRFSLSNIDNINLDLVNSRPIYMNRRK